MTDMLVKLSELPEPDPTTDFIIRRAMAYERGKVTGWIASVFNRQWADESQTAFGRQPIGCYIAVSKQSVIGFCCVDCTFLGFAGPIGVVEDRRGAGVGKALLIASLKSMQTSGYGYAVIGDVGVTGFFEKAVGATAIQDGKKSLYPDRLQ